MQSEIKKIFAKIVGISVSKIKPNTSPQKYKKVGLSCSYEFGYGF